MSALIDVIMPVFLVIGFGYLAVWKGYFSQSGVEGLMKFTQGFAIPCLLFLAISSLDLQQNFDFSLLFSFYTGALAGFIAAFTGARVLFKRDWEDCVAFGFCGLFSNSLLLGLPITERAYGPDALKANYAIIAIHSPFCYGLGITTMEFVRAREAGTSMARLPATVLKAMFSNVLIIALALGFLVNISGLNIPQTLQGALDMMVRSALPTALFALGGVLYRYRPEGDMKVIMFVVALSLILHPAITFTLGSLSGLGEAGLRSAVMTAAMAPGVNVYIFASIYQRALRVAASSVLIATGLSVFSAWFWLSVLP